MLYFLKKWWPSIVTILVVLYATLWPDPTGDTDIMIFPGFDKLVHAIMMGGIASAVLFDHRRFGKPLTMVYIVRVAVTIGIFSALDEYLQGVISPARTFDIWDIMANVGGILIASVTAPPVINRLFKKKSADEN